MSRTWMLALLAYVRYVENPRLGRYLLVGITLVLGLMAKSMLVTLPGVLLLLDYWPLRRFQPGSLLPTSSLGTKHERSGEPSRTLDDKSRSASKTYTVMSVSLRYLIYEKLPLLGVVTAFSIITVLTQKQAGTLIGLQEVSLGRRLANAPISYAIYLGKTIWPMQLAVFYPHSLGALSSGQVIGAAALLAGISGLVLWQARRRPFLCVGWFWFLGTLVPVIGIVQFGGAALADRYTYIPHIGLFLAAVWGFEALFANRKRLFLVLPGLWLIGCMVLTWKQTLVWRNSGTLWEHALRVTSANALAHQNLGAFLQQQGKLALAADHYRAALQISPQLDDAYRNLGECYLQWGEKKEALDCYHAALAINPDSASTHNHLGELLFQQRNLQEAADHFRAALAFDSDSTVALINLGAVVFHQGDMDQAILHYGAALRIDPDSAEAHSNLGEVLLRKGRLEEAIKHFREALRLNPNLAGAENNLGAALLQQGKWQEAEPHLANALKIDPTLASAHANLGFVLETKARLQEVRFHFSPAPPLK